MPLIDNCRVSQCLVDKGEAVPALALLGKGTDECPDPKTCPLLHALRLSIQSSYQALSGGFNEEFVGCCISAKECLQKLQEMERSGAFHNSPESYELYAQVGNKKFFQPFGKIGSLRSE